MKENSDRFQMKVLTPQKNSHGLSTDMEKVLNVLYVKE